MTTTMSVPARQVPAAVLPADGLIGGEGLKARMDLILDVARHVMTDNVDFGTIPGTDKPSLWKPGAEKLCVAFRVAAGEPQIEDLSTLDEVRYRVQVPGVSQINGALLGVGVGECSTNEKKYRWRYPVHQKEYDATPADRRRLVFKRDGTTYPQVRTEPADLANTVLKMAHKRAMVAMALLVTGASAIFSQDLEDLPEEMREPGHERQADAKKPQRASQTGGAKPSPEDALTTEPVAVKAVKEQKRDGKDSIFWIETADGQSYSTFDGNAAKELESFKGTDHKVRIGYVERKSTDGKKTYRNFVSVAIADDAPATTKAADPKPADEKPAAAAAEPSEQDIFGRK